MFIAEQLNLIKRQKFIMSRINLNSNICVIFLASRAYHTEHFATLVVLFYVIKEFAIFNCFCYLLGILYFIILILLNNHILTNKNNIKLFKLIKELELMVSMLVRSTIAIISFINFQVNVIQILMRHFYISIKIFFP